jgi:hypothetical protein
MTALETEVAAVRPKLAGAPAPAPGKTAHSVAEAVGVLKVPPAGEARRRPRIATPLP